MRPLGVGFVYWAALEPLLGPGGPAPSVLEIEPQALWEKVAHPAPWHYRPNEELFERLAALPQGKLLHGVGHPLGGTVPDPLDPVPLLRRCVQQLDPVWVSEHLSFNRVRGADGGIEHAGFLLPPPQSPAAVRVAAGNLGAFGRALGRPVAFETGVNYLRPREGELPDGEFFAAVAQAADSAILLDLHNLWCNERNGRQPVADVLQRLPLDRVWEIHLAGGMEADGFLLDAHSGAVPAPVLDMAAALIPQLPHLGALIFEILPEHLDRIGLDGVARQLETLQSLWRLRRPDICRTARANIAAGPEIPVGADDVASVAAWEQSLAAALGHRGAAGPDAEALAADPGCRLLRTLVGDFRRASLARALRYTLIALLAGLGRHGTEALLAAYFAAQPPEPFAAVEAEQFARFLQARGPLPVPHLDEVLAFEHALLRATVHGVSADVRWSVDPARLLQALDEGWLPAAVPRVDSVMRVCAA